MAKIANATHITVVDAMSFYYQWHLHPDSRWAFTIATHNGQYTFDVPIIGYKGLNAYVQRRMGNILRGAAARKVYESFHRAGRLITIPLTKEADCEDQASFFSIVLTLKHNS